MKHHFATLFVFTTLSLPMVGLFSTLPIVQFTSVAYAFMARYIFRHTRIGRALVAHLDELCAIL